MLESIVNAYDELLTPLQVAVDLTNSGRRRSAGAPVAARCREPWRSGSSSPAFWHVQRPIAMFVPDVSSPADGPARSAPRTVVPTSNACDQLLTSAS